jgi:hypothetical protein
VIIIVVSPTSPFNFILGYCSFNGGFEIQMEREIELEKRTKERERMREGFRREGDRGLKKIKIKNLTQLINFLPTSLSTQHANLEHPNVYVGY